MNEIFLNSVNSRKMINYWSMNKGQCNDLFCYLCLPGAVVARWSLPQEIAGFNTAIPLISHFLSLNLVKAFQKNSNIMMSASSRFHQPYIARFTFTYQHLISFTNSRRLIKKLHLGLR